jgi:hypothetical protein
MVKTLIAGFVGALLGTFAGVFILAAARDLRGRFRKAPSAPPPARPTPKVVETKTVQGATFHRLDQGVGWTRGKVDLD